MNSIDLHTHSTASDGTYTPTELVHYAASKGLSAIALTDHDTTDGIEEALAAAKELANDGINIEVIPGIEFSSEYRGKDIHIVGLYIDVHSDYFQRRLELFVNSRTKRNEEMVRRLNAHGIPVTMHELEALYPSSVITRAHFAKFMFNKGYVKSIKEAFDRYVGDRCPCFVPRAKISPMRAVEIIRKSGGVPILAHPVLYGMGKTELYKLTAKLKDSGLVGVEALYSTYNNSDERDIRALAKEYNLLLSGGSDFHGLNKATIDLGTGTGHLFVPEELLTKIKEKHNELVPDAPSFSLPKILFTDLDGTLLRNDKSISEFTYDILEKWTSAGHYIALNSGRDVNSIYNDVYKKLKFDEFKNFFLVAYNGGQIFDCEKKETIFRVGLPIEDVNYVEALANEYGIHIQTYSDSHIIAHDQSKELSYYQRVIKTPVMFADSFKDVLNVNPCKCLVIELDDTNKLHAFYDTLKPYADSHDISLCMSNPNYLEIIPSISGKGSSVAPLCDYIGISNIITVGAGDEENDISLLRACDVAIAMENGIDAIKDVSTTISEGDNEHDGLAKSLIDII